MTIFILLCVVMALVAAAAVVLPLWLGDKSAPEADRREQVLAILRRQAEELEADKAAGKIDSDEYEESRLELERRVLEEARGDELERSGAFARTARRIAIVLGFAVPCVAAGTYVWLGHHQAADRSYVEMMEAKSSNSGGHSAAEMQQMLENMIEEMKADPENAQGWYMLARTAASVNRFDVAADAFKTLNKLVPGNADLMADMADMMAAQNGKVITPDIEKILEEALKIDPKQWKALALLAMQAWDKQRYLEAAAYWERLIEVMPEDFGTVEQLRANIEEAKRLGGVNDNVSNGSPNAAKLDPVEKSPVPLAAPTDRLSVSGKVTLIDELKAKTKPDDTVFIYARPVDSRMPVAFMKVKVKDLPFEFTLDETMTMAMGADTLASVDTVIVGARISKTGNFMPQSGDIEGEKREPVKVGESGIRLEIVKVRP